MTSDPPNPFDRDLTSTADDAVTRSRARVAHSRRVIRSVERDVEDTRVAVDQSRDLLRTIERTGARWNAPS